jgi:hypothetical protein
MPEKKTMERAKRDLKQGKSASTAAGEFVREEVEHIRQGKHGARSTEQAIAIGLSKARRAGVPLAAPKAEKASSRTRRSAQRDLEVGQGRRKPRGSAKRRRATASALKREPRAAASKAALSRHAKAAAPRRTKRTASNGAGAKAGNARGKASSARGKASSARGKANSTPAASSASRGSSARRGGRASARAKAPSARRPRAASASA